MDNCKDRRCLKQKKAIKFSLPSSNQKEKKPQRSVNKPAGKAPVLKMQQLEGESCMKSPLKICSTFITSPKAVFSTTFTPNA